MMDAPRSRQIVIAGAGIAGLTAALAFAQRGFTVHLFERAKILEEAGAGIQLSPNATRILGRLGVLPRLLPAAVKPEAIDIRDARSLRPLASVALGTFADRRWGAPYLVVHRADLQSALVAHVRQQPAIELVIGAAVRDIAFHPRGATVSVDHAGRIVEIPAGLVIGADGVWSSLRKAGGRPVESRYSGSLAWRATVRPDIVAIEAARQLPRDRVTTYLDPDFHLVCYPMRGGAAINLVAVTRGPATPQQWANAADAGPLRSAMRNAAEPLKAMARDAGPWTSWPLHTVDPGGPWTSAAGMALVGDAAHATTPYAAQGAAMAIEDAATLAATVDQSPGDLGKALGRYETLRRRRVKRVAARGAFNHFAWHAAGPVAMARNLVLAHRSPERLAADLDWIYGWDLDTELAKIG